VKASTKSGGPRYSVGIDLGTTHTVVAYAPARSASAAVRIFAIDQLVAPGEVAARSLLPSSRYHVAPGELAPGATMLPWGDSEPGVVVGELARQQAAQVPGRGVASAKSWLSHAAVDRLAPILPWGAPDGVPRVSPVAASASYLAHLRAAWNHHHPRDPLEAQELVLTVPASFDEAARALTLQAARDAGLAAGLRLLEEPQAALYDWLHRHRRTLAQDLAGIGLVLVCDIGGGTTDLTLVQAAPGDDGVPQLQRIAVGRHLMLGGDNMDLALARRAEEKLAAADPGAPRLAAGALAQLVERCRAVKESLLAADAPASATVTLLGAGSRLVGGARSVGFDRDEVRQLVVEGFFPRVGADEAPLRARASGLVGFGLPYASDAAVTRHLAEFLQRHREAGWPDTLLLNGGVFRAGAIADRLAETLAGWRGAPLRRLDNDDADLAVARGAVAYALARRGLGPRIGGGSARAYFLALDEPAGGIAAPCVCLLPQGADEGHEWRLAGRRFALRVGEPVRFRLLAADALGSAPPHAGDLLDRAALDAQPLPPLATVIRAEGRHEPKVERAHEGKVERKVERAVELAATLTEVGTLELACIAADDPAQRWQLEFQLRGDAAAGGVDMGRLPPRFADAVSAIGRVFGPRDRHADPNAARRLRSELESLLGPRERWPTPLLRALFDALSPLARARRRSADHERQWFSLAGWCLRPGFGDALDGWRIEQLWPIYAQGVQHGHEAQVLSEWWTLWRRVAGGLAEEAQDRLLQDFAFNLRGAEAGLDERPPQLPRGQRDDMLRLGASLERVPAEHKAEIGEWLVQGLQSRGGKAAPADPWVLWAIGRLGARVPLYGSAHGVVAVETVARWLETLLALDWKKADGAAAAAANLARRSGDRARDLPPELAERVIDRLLAQGAPAAWIDRVRQVVALDEAGERSLFGDALPPGLKLIA
jgi:molecular chaperone DnaK (HSP70)